MRLVAACALAALLLAGCKSYPLGSDWAPLVAVEENPEIPAGFTTTIADHCYTQSLVAWLEWYPPGSVDQYALLLHEQIHARHQLSSGNMVRWLYDYATSSSFRWDEERQGYHEEIRYLTKRGRQVDAQDLARSMATGYRGTDGPMVDEDAARAWILSEIEDAKR